MTATMMGTLCMARGADTHRRVSAAPPPPACKALAAPRLSKSSCCSRGRHVGLSSGHPKNLIWSVDTDDTDAGPWEASLVRTAEQYHLVFWEVAFSRKQHRCQTVTLGISGRTYPRPPGTPRSVPLGLDSPWAGEGQLCR